MTHQRYTAYRLLLAELDEWHSGRALGDEAHSELCDAAEGLLLARRGMEAEEPLARASSTVLAMLAVNDLDEPHAARLLDRLLACGPRFRPAPETLSRAA
jgi:hypothetical protein